LPVFFAIWGVAKVGCDAVTIIAAAASIIITIPVIPNKTARIVVFGIVDLPTIASIAADIPRYVVQILLLMTIIIVAPLVRSGPR
jgi:hypothetical protein